jgi:drug/metabolite transporter (DMT)-like permease
MSELPEPGPTAAAPGSACPAAAPSTSDSRLAALGLVATSVAVTSWGIGPVVVKLTDLPSLVVSFWRLTLGAVALVTILYVRGGRLSWRLLRGAIPGGLAFAFDILLFFAAVRLTTVADATIISALQPALVLLVVGRLFGERVAERDIAWTGVAIVGVAVVVFASGQVEGRSLTGDVLATLSLGAWAGYFVAAKQARRHFGALEYQAALALVSAVVVLPVALIGADDLAVSGGRTWGLLVLCITIGVAGHFLINWAHAYTPLTISSLMTLASPVVSVVAAAVLLDEPVLWAHIAGMAMVLGSLGIVIAHTTASSRRARALEGLEEVV